MPALEIIRNLWHSYVLKISANRDPGYIGNAPYLLILRCLAILAVSTRFMLPFSRWAGNRDFTNILIPSAIAVWIVETIVLAFVTRRPFEPSSRMRRRI